MSNCKCGDSLDTTEAKACGACINCAQADLAAANAVIEGQERGILALGARIDGLRTRLAAANETIGRLEEDSCAAYAAFGVAMREKDDQLAAANETIARLPKTKDGVPAVPGMKLYPLHPIPDTEDDHGIVTIGM